MCLGQRLRALEQRLDLVADVRRHTVREVLGIDTELLGQPAQRLLRRARLAPLDLADVLLREAVARELCLRQPGRDAEPAHALAEPRHGSES